MAEQFFTGPGYLRLLNESGSIQVTNVITGVTVGMFDGTPYNGSTSDTVTGEVYISEGEHKVSYPDEFGTTNCSPSVPVFSFISDSTSGGVDLVPVIDAITEVVDAIIDKKLTCESELNLCPETIVSVVDPIVEAIGETSVIPSDVVGELQYVVDDQGNKATGYYVIDNGVSTFVPIQQDVGFDPNTSVPQEKPLRTSETVPLCYIQQEYISTKTIDVSTFTDFSIATLRVLTPNNPRPTYTEFGSPPDQIMIKDTGVILSQASIDATVAIFRQGLILSMENRKLIYPTDKSVLSQLSVKVDGDIVTIIMGIIGEPYAMNYQQYVDGVGDATYYTPDATIPLNSDFTGSQLIFFNDGIVDYRVFYDNQFNQLDINDITVISCDEEDAPPSFYNVTQSLALAGNTFLGSSIVEPLTTLSFYVESGEVRVSYDTGGTFEVTLTGASSIINLAEATTKTINNLIIEALEDNTVIQLAGYY